MRLEAGDGGRAVLEVERGREAAEVTDHEGLVLLQLDDGGPRTGDEASQLSAGSRAAKQKLVGKPDQIVYKFATKYNYFTLNVSAFL